MSRRTAVAVLLVLLSAGCASPPPPMPGGAAEWRWEGRHRIDSFLEVPEGVTLLLLPGTVLEFTYRDGDGDGYGDNGLHVKGSIVAVGREGAPVVFTSAREKPEPGDWGGLLLDNSRENLFEFCTIEFARHALHTHFSSGSIRRARIVNNIEGTRLGDSRFEIAFSLIAGNISKGLNFRSCANTIRRNSITGNGHGIFLFETDTATVIEENNIHGNEGYDFRLGDFYEGGFTLRGNWWGTADEEAVRRRIFEGDDPGRRGRVRISPAAAPLETGWEQQ
jgi:parallel beta-helix repeat protein